MQSNQSNRPMNDRINPVRLQRRMSLERFLKSTLMEPSTKFGKHLQRPRGSKRGFRHLPISTFKVGGKWRANYNASGKLGDQATIENTILCYDPKRMIAFKATGLPEDFQFKNAAKDSWSIFYFTRLADRKTKITIVGLGFNESDESKKCVRF